MGFVGPILINCERLPFEVFYCCLCNGHLGVTYANMLVTTQWPLKRAAHLTSLVWVCVVCRPESLMELSALCYCQTIFKITSISYDVCIHKPPLSTDVFVDVNTPISRINTMDINDIERSSSYGLWDIFKCCTIHCENIHPSVFWRVKF